MAKYDPLHDFLRASRAPSTIDLSFKQVEVILRESMVHWVDVGAGMVTFKRG